MKIHKQTEHRGFSLVELLVVIAVIAIIAAIAIPNISSITGAADDAKDQRNAQNIASVYSAAIAADAQETQTDLESATEATVIDALRDGVTGNVGSLTNSTYQVDGLSDDDRDAAEEFLDIRTDAAGNNRLFYTPDGTSP